MIFSLQYIIILGDLLFLYYLHITIFLAKKIFGMLSENIFSFFGKTKLNISIVIISIYILYYIFRIYFSIWLL